VSALIRIAGVAAIASGCTASEPDTAGPPTFTSIYTELFPRATRYQCEFCHGLPANEKSNGKLAMGMDQATSYAALVGKPATGDTCQQGMQLVAPGDPDHSLFFLKFGDSPPCGDRMPLAGAALSNAQLEQVRTWILDGAQDD
jgi:hypothetical protein